MADFLGLMKQAAELKSKMEAMQAELEASEVEGLAGGGLVTVKLNGKGDLKGVRIDETLIKPSEKEILEDLIVAAHADARRKVETLMQGQDAERRRRPAAAAGDEAVLIKNDAAAGKIRRSPPDGECSWTKTPRRYQPRSQAFWPVIS